MPRRRANRNRGPIRSDANGTLEPASGYHRSAASTHRPAGGHPFDAAHFIPGLDVAELFYRELVRPILDARYPGLPHTAALLGSGSEVLGYDTARSMDHEWGVRVQLFLRAEDHAELAPAIGELLSRDLPHEFRGLPVDLIRSSPTSRNAIMTRVAEGPVRHGVQVTSVEAFCTGYLGLDPRQGMTARDWLTIPQQRLLATTAGRVMHDGLGELEPLRARLNYYPDDVWIALLAAQWRRVDQEEPFVARTGDAGDDLGSSIVAARQAREVMRLCFLMERRYWPYTKWFGTAFARLPCADRVGPHLVAALTASDWRAREAALSGAYSAVAEMHNALGLTPSIETTVSRFHTRPYLVIHSGRFVDALRKRIVDPFLREVAWTGTVDQFADSTDVLAYPARYTRLGQLIVDPR